MPKRLKLHISYLPSCLFWPHGVPRAIILCQAGNSALVGPNTWLRCSYSLLFLTQQHQRPTRTACSSWLPSLPSLDPLSLKGFQTNATSQPSSSKVTDSLAPDHPLNCNYQLPENICFHIILCYISYSINVNKAKTHYTPIAELWPEDKQLYTYSESSESSQD